MKGAAIVCLLFAFCTCLSYGQSNNLSIAGFYEIKSAILSETRIVNVYLPDGYNETDTQRYPVIYLLDGGLDEDFLHVIGLVQFDSQPWVGRLPKSIVVGITNVDRKRDFTFPTAIADYKEILPTGGKSAAFIAFIEKELQPFVKRMFRVNGTKTLIGESLGGLLATEVLLTKPYLFDYFIIISPSIWWDNASILKRRMAKAGSKTNVFIAVGKEGLTLGKQARVMEVDANLLKEKIDNAHDKNVRVYLDYLPDENHATIAHKAIYNAFRHLFAIPEGQ